ncbi:MAG: macrocin O-methyltransferase [Alteromonadaceae bacterium TMED7]|nr:macrocin O-methyltransferase [Alteromonadaceae bacterium]RPH16975.1 MAG: macrocin O-methyltransferase [Alteromonadaceae bacterium TMED7]|tara:strand:- start:23606 stop:24292 length:687 start_codon:yes stop_codon:yes gene_type:complete
MNFPPDYTESEKALISYVKPYTMTSVYKLKALIDAVTYIHARKIPGDFVECGVWKGGSVMAMIKTLELCLAQPRKIWLFDTFEGMPPPSPKDTALDGHDVNEFFAKTQIDETSSDWCRSPLDEVKQNVALTGYDPQHLNFVKGDVCKTLQGDKPESIALLRLDTDWYESTKAELENLFPRLQTGGILIIDDYGYWEGQKEAVDEYFSTVAEPVFLGRVDSPCRIAVKI